MEKEILANFKVSVEKIQLDETDEGTILVSFYAPDGSYIGDINCFKRLVCDRGIIPQKNAGTVSVIGKSFKDMKWYGWSHRAIFGFGIGDIVKKGDCCASSGYTDEYLKDHLDPYVLPVGFMAKTDEDCKKMAIAFSKSVG